MNPVLPVAGMLNPPHRYNGGSIVRRQKRDVPGGQNSRPEQQTENGCLPGCTALGEAGSKTNGFASQREKEVLPAATGNECRYR